MDSSRNDNKIPTIDSIPRSTSVHDDNKIPPVIGTPEGKPHCVDNVTTFTIAK